MNIKLYEKMTEGMNAFVTKEPELASLVTEGKLFYDSFMEKIIYSLEKVHDGSIDNTKDRMPIFEVKGKGRRKSFWVYISTDKDVCLMYRNELNNLLNRFAEASEKASCV